tara:strand:+ start:13136 stop:13561 length:426 start_codon:yes stop_codon:yes gene_type:complete
MRKMSIHSVKMIYSANNIKYELCELFSDFSQSLLSIVFQTYLGDDVMNDDDKYAHFKWCWEKNIENFKSEGIIFEHNDNAFEHYYLYLYSSYWDFEKTEELNNELKLDWLNILNYDKNKIGGDIELLIESYLMLEKSLKIN